jgi:hypothetical protein
MYLSIVTGLMNRRFDIYVNVFLWNDNWPIGSKKPNIIKAIPNSRNEPYNIIMLTECANLDVQGVILKYGKNI